MDELDQDDLKAVWKQREIPVVYRSGEKGAKLLVRLPRTGTHDPFFTIFAWFRGLGIRSPDYDGNKDYWRPPSSRLNVIVDEALQKYGKCHIIQPFREMEVCSPSCRNATGHKCDCSCMGAHHGTGDGHGWFDVAEAFSVRWGEKSLACRLLLRR